MATAPPSGPRLEFFRQLKPICVPLSKITLSTTDKAAQAKEVYDLIESLNSLWTAQVSKDAAILDEKSADYVFFPLSYLLRSQDQYPVRVIEATIRLLKTLIQYGWKAKISQQLAQQLLIFLSFTIGDAPGQSKKRDLPEETILEAYRAITAIITVVDSSTLTLAIPSSSTGDNEIPALGHTITVVLDGIAFNTATPLIQLEALKCLRAVFTSIRDNAVLAKFLPGTVSSLSRILSPPLQQKTQRRVLVSCLELLSLVLVNVLGDIKVRGILKQLESTKDLQEAQATGKIEDDKARTELTPSWLKATASQVKIALSSVLKLRNHEHEDVQAALDRLCISLLDECHSSLAECQAILVESAMMLENEESRSSTLETSLQDLAQIYPELGDSIKSTLYKWITGLPRLMQSVDERTKQLAIRNILRGTKLAAALQMDSSTLNDSLGNALRDSIVALIKASKQPKVVDDGGIEGNMSSAGTDITKSHTEVEPYHPVLFDLEGQKTTRTEISALISNIGSSVQQAELAAAMLGYLRDVDGVDQIASYWLTFELLKATYAQSSDLDEMFDLSSLEESRSQEGAFQGLYDFSTSVLASHSDSLDHHDWRLEAIALEVTAFAASRLKTEFRPELIDVLYPVTTFLGSQTPQLRRHAITTLNRLAVYCGYGSVSELIIDNVDYMVNSISLRLNTFDISPASTKVLTMMIRLTGPRLIPFLDDVVAAIFAALDNYHGYPVFVESLFSVLSEVVTQGTKSDTLLLEGSASKAIDHKKKRLQYRGITETLAILDKRAERAKRLQEEEEEEEEADLDSAHQGHPKKPWGDPDKSEAKSLLDKLQSLDDPASDEEAEEEEPSPSAVDKPETPKTPTYNLLARVMTLTQHYLTSPTPTLRKLLLELVATVSPALAPDEDAFLPLVHVLWPVVVARLRDPEPFVAIAACRALAALCEAAGDFLSTRFKSEWWDEGLGKCGGGAAAGDILIPGRRAETSGLNVSGGVGGGQMFTRDLSLSLSSGPAPMSIQPSSSSSLSASTSTLIPSSSPSYSSGALLGRFSQASQVWDAVVGLLGAIVTYVRVDDYMFDEMLELVADVLSLPGHEALKEAFETVNAGAVWLALYKRGKIQREWKQPEPVEGFAWLQMPVKVW
ncbi:armadillo-type protein [Bombardia bombarda]|uniref:Armadillo-type protein n=1 Tax=Bombardia bombarda TaxID=252184 RepID=A0AA40C1Q3_9PEZI|nr:armadillo-type protein [Bombardia bombarda]